MRFSQWLKKLDGQQARLNELALSPVSESISVDGKLITITIGKGQYDCEADGSKTAPCFLRPLYTNNKEEFDAMLESITEATDRVVEATEVILTSVSREAVPAAVMARMKGEKVSGDPAELVTSMTESKLKKLHETLWGEQPYGGFDSFDFNFSPVAGKALSLVLNIRLHIMWGRISTDGSRFGIPDVEEAMYFLANFEVIKERILRFIEQVKAIK